MRCVSTTAACLLALTLVAAGGAHCLGTPAGTTITVSADLTCQDYSSPISAEAVLQVDQEPGFAMQAGALPGDAVPGAVSFVPLTITNTGNGADSAGLATTGPAGWSVAIIADTNGDRIHQPDEQTVVASTGPVQADQSVTCFLAIIPPAGATGSGQVSVTAVSALAPAGVAAGLTVSVPVQSDSQPVTATMAFNPGIVQVPVGQPAMTPPILLVDSALPMLVQFNVALPDGVTIDTTMSGDSLACITKGDAVTTLKSSWDVANRQINITASLSSAYMGAQVVKSIVITASASADGHALLIDNLPALSVRTYQPAAQPGDLNSDGAVNQADLDLFGREWFLWHWQTIPAFLSTTDGLYDLAPRTSGVWPNFRSIGDSTIDANDATVMTECMLGSQNANPSYDGSTVTYRNYNRIDVYVMNAPYGIFRADVVLPIGSIFNPGTNAYGNLTFVLPQAGAGSIYFSELNSATRTIRITGTVTGIPPYYVSQIVLYR